MSKRGSWSRPICSHISFFIPCFHSSILTFASEYIFQLYCGGLLFLLFKLRNKKGFYTQVLLYGEWCNGQYHSLSVGDILKLIYRASNKISKIFDCSSLDCEQIMDRI